MREAERKALDFALAQLRMAYDLRNAGDPESYAIDMGADGKPLTKTAQVRMCGNSVCPPLAQAIVAANYSEAVQERKAA